MESHIPTLILWLLPALFVVHDMEEILFLPSWLRCNREGLRRRFPALVRRLLPRLEAVSSRLFAAMAAEELLLIVAVTVYSTVSGNQYCWLALWLAFGVHLVVHLGQCLVVRNYIPSMATSLLCLPVWGYVVWRLADAGLFTIREFTLCAVAGSLVAALNLLLIHRMVAIVVRRH